MFSLVADYDNTSSSSSERDDTDNEDTEKHQSNICSTSSAVAMPTSKILLPSADALLSGGSSKSAGDVFSNPFLEAEKSEINKLQKHVKMVESENHLLQKNGRKICWNNRKGRCRFGNKCKYAHDSDLVEDQDVAVNKTIINQEIKIPAIQKSLYSSEGSTSELMDIKNNPNEKIKTRKRPGLGDSIVPGKRIMKSYRNMKTTSL